MRNTFDAEMTQFQNDLLASVRQMKAGISTRVNQNAAPLAAPSRTPMRSAVSRLPPSGDLRIRSPIYTYLLVANAHDVRSDADLIDDQFDIDR